MFYRLQYFKKSKAGICADDFKNKTEVETLNLSFVISISDLLRFVKPLTGTFVGHYGELTMSNGYTYYIHEDSFSYLQNAIGEQKLQQSDNSFNKVVVFNDPLNPPTKSEGNEVEK